ncbi:hypothetical protein G7Y79_00021g049780 [Physcia stellaris]|nr:hypothetical protein G7Y79_00021g049780 [Physcia stellaris]
MAAFTPAYASPALASTPTPAATSKSTPAQQSVEHVTSPPTPAITSEFATASDLLPFSPALCDHVPEGHPMTQDLKTLYSMHLNGDVKALRCSWYVQAKKAQETYHLRKHELQMKSKVKQEAKELLKQQEEARLAKKRAEGYTCRRCKTAKFDSNTKLHEHIRTRHAKKPKPAQQSVVSPASESKPPHLLLRHLNRSPRHLPRHRNSYLSRCLHQKSYTSFRNPVRFLVGCNTKKADILGRNCLTACCAETLTSPDCDTQIGVQTVGECKHCLPAYSASNAYTIEALSYCERPVPHVRWEAESIWPAAAPNALLFSEGPWQKQF